MRVPTLIPPGIEAAAWRFAKASLRDGHGKYASTMLAREGVPRIIEFYDNDGTQHFCENIKDSKHLDLGSGFYGSCFFASNQLACLGCPFKGNLWGDFGCLFFGQALAIQYIYPV